MNSIRSAVVSSCLLLAAMPAALPAKPVYLSCRTDDPAWPPPLNITLDEDRGTAMVSDVNSSGESPKPIFKSDSVEFGFDGSRFIIDRTNLQLTTTNYVKWYKTVCKIVTPAKRAF